MKTPLKNKAPLGVPVYKAESYFKNIDPFSDDEEIVVTEKIDGKAARFAYINEEFYYGTGTRFPIKTDDKDILYVSSKYAIPNMLTHDQDFVIYGEIFGRKVTNSSYEEINGANLVVFDVYNMRTSKFLNFSDFMYFCKNRYLPTAPILYMGPRKYANFAHIVSGPTAIGSSDKDEGGRCVREGVVIRSLDYNKDRRLKYVSNEFYQKNVLNRK